MTIEAWLHVTRGDAPLVVSIPHAGSDLPADLEARLASPWLARQDADWHLERLYDFARDLGATLVRTTMSRTVIDVNRDPSGASLYPGQPTTGLCPTETFDGEPLYAAGDGPGEREVAERRTRYFEPYHRAVHLELRRLRAHHEHVVLYDCHSIRSVIPRLFAGALPQWNIGTNDGRSCAAALTRVIEMHCDATELTRVTNGRFKGGYITRHYGRPLDGIHAIQMELACRGYMTEPEMVTSDNWPSPYVDEHAAALRTTLRAILSGALAWAREAPIASTEGVL